MPALGLFGLNRRFTQAIQDVTQGHQRVGQGHARAGIAHHHPDTLTHIRPVAVDRAARAAGLALLVGASLQPRQGVIQHGAAFGAQIRAIAVLAAAVKSQHRFQRFRFAC